MSTPTASPRSGSHHQTARLRPAPTHQGDQQGQAVQGPGNDTLPHLAPALTRPIRWDIIEQNYEQMIAYATAIRVGTASTESILRRFTCNASHRRHQAMLEVGRAQKTIFVCRYLRSRALQREINAGLNVVEAWNGVNDVIFFGKSGEVKPPTGATSSKWRPGASPTSSGRGSTSTSPHDPRPITDAD